MAPATPVITPVKLAAMEQTPNAAAAIRATINWGNLV